LEATPNEFVDQLVLVFREVRRVLRKDGTLWLNLGDSYAGGGYGGGGSYEDERNWRKGNPQGQSNRDGLGRVSGLKSKDLCGIPWRVAFALQADGWWLRQDIIWSKPNPMPESVTDRCTKAHEYLFLLSKSERYYYDAEAIAEPSIRSGTIPGGCYADKKGDGQFTVNNRYAAGMVPANRNKRSVWEVATQPFSEAHFATFPPALIEPCIMAGTSEKGCCAKCGASWMREVERAAMVIDRSIRTHAMGRTRASGTMVVPPSLNTTGWSPSCNCDAPAIPCTVLDPFGGAGTTGLVADRLQRNAILIELKPTYATMAENRLRDDAGMFAAVAVPETVPRSPKNLLDAVEGRIGDESGTNRDGFP
jgi:DNA modification methylase